MGAMITSSLHVDDKHSTIKTYHKESRALRTKTTINDPSNFGIGKSAASKEYADLFSPHARRPVEFF